MADVEVRRESHMQIGLQSGHPSCARYVSKPDNPLGYVDEGRFALALQPLPRAVSSIRELRTPLDGKKKQKKNAPFYYSRSTVPRMPGCGITIMADSESSAESVEFRHFGCQKFILRNIESFFR